MQFPPLSATRSDVGVFDRSQAKITISNLRLGLSTDSTKLAG